MGLEQELTEKNSPSLFPSAFAARHRAQPALQGADQEPRVHCARPDIVEQHARSHRVHVLAHLGLQRHGRVVAGKPRRRLAALRFGRAAHANQRWQKVEVARQGVGRARGEIGVDDDERDVRVLLVGHRSLAAQPAVGAAHLAVVGREDPLLLAGSDQAKFLTLQQYRSNNNPF